MFRTKKERKGSGFSEHKRPARVLHPLRFIGVHPCLSVVELNSYADSCTSNLRARSGFSLVETLCAVLILGVALTGMVQAVTTALSSTKESELQTVAALFAAGQIEKVRAEGDLHDGTSQGECGDELPLYRWEQTIGAAGIAGLHEVTVSLENSRSGKIIYELKTLLFEVPDESQPSSNTRARDSGSRRSRTRTR